MITDSTRSMTIPDYRLDPPSPPRYLPCPFCGTELYDYIVEDICGDVVGCSECIRQLSAEEYLEKED